MTRRIATTVATSLTALVALAVPALAGSSFTAGAEAQADSDHGLTLTVTEPESEDYGDTARVTVVAPSSFTVVGCQQEPSWDCTADADAGRVTFTRTVLGVLGDNTLQFTVHTPKTNGTYRFQVTQADGAEEPNTVRSGPTVTVVGGTDPQPEPDDSGGDDGGGGTDDGGSTGGDTSGGTDSTDDSGSAADDPATEGSGSTTDDPAEDTSSSTSDDGSTSGGGGTTTPRRSEGRSNGTSLDITPGQPFGDDSAIDAPDVADDPAIAPPSDGEQDDADTGTATMTAIEGQVADDSDDTGGLPWQQLLGGALLVAGGAAVAVRRWDVLARVRDADVLARVRDADVLARVRGWDPLDRIRRWRS